jgi:hypothetical protein
MFTSLSFQTNSGCAKENQNIHFFNSYRLLKIAADGPLLLPFLLLIFIPHDCTIDDADNCYKNTEQVSKKNRNTCKSQHLSLLSIYYKKYI